jgi:septal ring-binding cell division protein DamX
LKHKPIKTFLLGTGIFTLSACTLFDDTSVGSMRQESLGWYCEADIDASDQWRCSERLMSGALPIDKSQSLETLPQPAEKVPMQTAKSQPVEKNLFEQAPKKIIQKKVEPDFDTFDISTNGYTVQLGAYLSQAMAEQSATKIINNGGQLFVHSIIVGGQTRFVIVQGQYPTRQQAQAVAERLITLNPQLEYWVRSIKSLRKSL